jgi:putative endopeptidase
MTRPAVRALLFGGAMALAAAQGAQAEDRDKPLLGTWGFDTTAIDRAEKPGDDFFRYVNGAWLDRTTIPADKSAITRRLEMTDRTESRLHEILEASAAKAGHRPHDLDGKAGAFYRAFMDEARIERLGASPIEPELAAVRTSRDRAALAARMGRTTVGFEASLYSVNIDIDLKQPTRYAIYLGQAGLGLPDRDYYLDSGMAAIKSAYQAYVAQLLGLLHWPDAPERAKEVVEFETRIAAASWTKTQQRDLTAAYNPMNREALGRLTPGFNWQGLLESAGVAGRDHYIVAENTAFPKIAREFEATPVATLKAWQAFHVADNAAPYLSRPFAAAWSALHDKVLAGQAQERPRWKRAITAVSGGDFGVGDRFGTFGTLGWAVGELYTAQYFPPAAKAKVEELVRNLTASYRARLEKLDWMSAATKTEALHKLDTFTVKVGYPNHPRNYSTVVIDDDDLTGDVRRAAALDWNFYVRRSAGPVDQSSWDMTPQTNDAYNGSLRDIVFPAGILQPPIFDANADDAINYGAIGGVIGHELTHGFDDQGRKIDSLGALRDWWSPADAAQFNSRAAMLAAQYSAFHPLPADPAVHVNGELTLGENIADLGGLTLALDAYQASHGGAGAPVIDGFSGTQRVFLGWAQAWCGKTSDEFLRKQVLSDPHSPRQFRVDGVVRNIDAWYQAFDVKPGDKLYLLPQDRVRIW